MRLRRTCLSVPGASRRKLQKARELPADEVVLDLEDSVAPADKTDETRELVAEALHAGPWSARTLAVRVNAVGTPWCADDLAHLVPRAGARIDCVVVPKVESADHVLYVADRLTELETATGLERKIAIEALIETPRGLVEVERIAGASDRLESLVFGPGDLAAALGMPQLSIGGAEPDYPGDVWHYALSRIVVAARAFGLQAVDGPYAALGDLAGFRESARRSALLGYDGKWVIHPEQIGPCNELYTPTIEQIEAAQSIERAYGRLAEEDGAGVGRHGGEMIDEATRKMAEAVLARGAGGARGLGGSDGMTAPKEWRGRFYEDLAVGDVFRSRIGRTISETDNVWFTALTHNTNQVHFNTPYAERTLFAKPLVNSSFTLALVLGLSVADTSENAAANLGWDAIRLPNPVYAGDTLWAESEVLSVRQSASNPSVGIVKVRTRGINQRGEVVIEFARSFMLYKRDAAEIRDGFPETQEPWTLA